MSPEINSVIDIIEELKDDSGVPKNIKDKLNSIVAVLKEDGDISIKVNKVLHDLDEVADDVNLEPYTRTQIWNIVSVLEKVA